MVTRRGYLHALEGMLAAIIVIVYLSTLINTPEPTNWERAHVSKRSSDLITAMDGAGMLDRFIMRGDVDSFNAFVNTVDSALSYRIKVSGLPPTHIDVGILANASATDVLNTQSGAGGLSGMGASENGVYRNGFLSQLNGTGLSDCTGGGAPWFCQRQFVLSDKEMNGIEKMTTIHLDFDNDGDVSDPEEGPYTFGDRFLCNATDSGGPPPVPAPIFNRVEGCDGNYFEVGPLNDTITIFKANFAHQLDLTAGNATFAERTITLDIRSVNAGMQSLDPFDTLIAPGWTVSTVQGIQSALEDFLTDGNAVIIAAAVNPAGIDSNYYGDLGFDYLNAYSLGGGATTNTFYTLSGVGNRSYRTNHYYRNTDLVVRGFTDQGTYWSGTLAVNGEDIPFNVSQSTGDITFAPVTTERYAVGERVNLAGNDYRITDTKPLRLRPLGDQRFTTFNTERVGADYHVTRLAYQQYNTSDYDKSATYTTDITNAANIPDGVIKPPTCTPITTYPYREGQITVDGTPYSFVMVNMNVSPVSCSDQYYEFVYLDMDCASSCDNAYDKNATDTAPGYTGEGIYQIGSSVRINNRSYTMQPFTNGTGIRLQETGPRIAGEVPVARNVVQNRGSVALFGRAPTATDELALLRSVIMVESERAAWFTTPRDFGENAFGYVHTAEAGPGNILHYTLDTVWWFG